MFIFTMKKLIIMLCISTSVMQFTQVKSQPNLVPNYSFEDTLNCGSSQFYLEDIVTFWCGGRGYFNACRSFYFGVPNNIFGLQYAKTGNAYCGIYTAANGTSPLRQYIQTKLNAQLSVNKKYRGRR